jgi:hypothetical protein
LSSQALSRLVAIAVLRGLAFEVELERRLRRARGFDVRRELMSTRAEVLTSVGYNVAAGGISASSFAIERATSCK